MDNTGAASRQAVNENLLVSALYRDGFIRRDSEGYVIDVSARIEKRYGGNEGVSATTKDVRAILNKVAAGLVELGYPVRKTFLEEALNGVKESEEDKAGESDLAETDALDTFSDTP